jgi:hypothetical protein
MTHTKAHALPAGVHCDHGPGAATGLYLSVKGEGRSWIYRFVSPVHDRAR